MRVRRPRGSVDRSEVVFSVGPTGDRWSEERQSYFYFSFLVANMAENSLSSRLLRSIRNLPNRLPPRLRSGLRLFQPIYQSTLSLAYALYPERTETTKWGPRILVDYRNYVERELAFGSFEADRIPFFLNRVRNKSMKFADVGANIGFYSLLFEIHSEQGSEIDAFEPVAHNIERFRENIRMNDCSSINIFPFVLSDESGEVTLSLAAGDYSDSTLATTAWNRNVTKTKTVSARTLDDVYYGGDHSPPDLIKIDVEGAEVKVLRGGKLTLSEFQPDLMVEIHRPLIANLGDSVYSLVEILDEAGYSTVTVIEDAIEMSLQEFARSPYFHESREIYVR